LNQLFLLKIFLQILTLRAALFPPVANEPSVDNDEDKLKKELENSEPVKSSILKAINSKNDLNKSDKEEGGVGGNLGSGSASSSSGNNENVGGGNSGTGDIRTSSSSSTAPKSSSTVEYVLDKQSSDTSSFLDSEGE
jgi:hypothetical protein